MYRRMRFPNWIERALTLSYDDGVRQDIRLIEIMKKYGLKGTFNINTGMFAPEDAVYTEGHGRMKEKEAYDLYRESGMEVAVHAYSHPRLETLTDTEVTYEVLQDRLNIEKATGKITRGMAYPYGSTSNAVIECLKKCGILYSRTTVATNNFNIPNDWLRLPATCHHNSPELMNLAQRFVDAKVAHDPLLFYLWGHSYEFDTNDNWQVIEKFAEFIGNRTDVWYATNTEVFEYIEAYRRLSTSADGTLIHNPTNITLYFQIYDNKYKVEPGETVKIM